MQSLSPTFSTLVLAVSSHRLKRDHVEPNLYKHTDIHFPWEESSYSDELSSNCLLQLLQQTLDPERLQHLQSQKSIQGTSSSSRHFNVRRDELRSSCSFLPKRPCAKFPSKWKRTVSKLEHPSKKVRNSTKWVSQKQQQKTECTPVSRLPKSRCKTKAILFPSNVSQSTMITTNFAGFSLHQSKHETCCQDIHSYAIIRCLVRTEQATRKWDACSFQFLEQQAQCQAFSSHFSDKMKHLGKGSTTKTQIIKKKKEDQCKVPRKARNLTSKPTGKGQPPTSSGEKMM